MSESFKKPESFEEPKSNIAEVRGRIFQAFRIRPEDENETTLVYQGVDERLLPSIDLLVKGINTTDIKFAEDLTDLTEKGITWYCNNDGYCYINDMSKHYGPEQN